MNNSVIERYENKLNELQNKLQEVIYNRNFSQLGHYDLLEENLKEEINKTNRIITIYNSIMSRIDGIDTNLEQDDIDRLIDSINFEKRNLPSDLASVIDDKLTKLKEGKDFGSAGEEHSYQWYLQKREELQKIARDSISTMRLGMGLNRPSEEIERQLKEVNRIINTYNNLIMNIRKVKHLKETKPDGYEDEVNRLNEIIERDKKTLPKNLLEEIEEYFKKEESESKKKKKGHKVEGTRKWNLTPKQKKILIGVGIAAVVTAVIVATQALIPAIVAAQHASNVSALAGSMVHNSALWHTSSAGVQTALHTLNVNLGSLMSSITGQEALFHGATGVWTIGGTELSAFAANAATAAQAAAAKVTAISATAKVLGIAGLGSLGTGIFSVAKDKLKNKENKTEKSKKTEMSAHAYEEYNETYLRMKKFFEEKGATIALEDDIYDMYDEISDDEKLNELDRAKLIFKVGLLRRKITRQLDEESKRKQSHNKSKADQPSSQHTLPNENKIYQKIYNYLEQINEKLDTLGPEAVDIDSKKLTDFNDLILNSKELTTEEKNRLLAELSVISEKMAKAESEEPNLGGRSK